MFKKSTAVAYFPIGRFVSTSDGTEVTTGTVTATYSKDGTAGAIAGTATYNATSKEWGIALLAAETDGDVIGLNFTLAGCVPIHYTISTEAKKLADLNDIPATAIVSGGAITTSSGSVVSVVTAGTATTVTNPVTVGTNGDKTGYALASPPPTAVQIRTELDANSARLANLDATVSSRMATFGLPANFAALGITAGGKISEVVLVDTCNVNADMRGTDGALLSGSYTPPDNASIALVKAVTDKLGDTVQDDGSGVWQFTADALALAPSAGSAPTAAEIRQEIDANSTQLAAIRGVTDHVGTAIQSDGGSGFQFTETALALAPTGGSAPTAVEIRDELDANSVKLANLDAAVSSRSTFDGSTVASITNPVTISLAQAVPTTNAPNTVGDCLNASRADGFGKWTKVGTVLTLYAPDGITAVRVFNLDDSTAPTTRS